MANKRNFKVGDRVKCELYDYGTVVEINEGKFPVEVELLSDGNCISYTQDGESQTNKLSGVNTLKLISEEEYKNI